MVPWGLISGVLLLASGMAQAQALLQVQPMASRSGSKNEHFSDDWREEATRSFHRTETLRITVTNMQTNPANYEVEWRFLARDVESKTIYVHDKGVRPVSLKAGEFKAFEFQSLPLPETQSTSSTYTYYDGNLWSSSQRSDSGGKPYGYVFLLKSNGKIIGVEASSRDLVEKFQPEVTANTLFPPPWGR